MAKINVLTSEIYNRIAAGEVVERPASVIKELLENSIDAGAKNIAVNISSGGIERMRVTDDGCGIDKEDLAKAFLPHATSKIAGVKDLDNIMTLGFRGEALASIASVAKVRLISSSAQSDFGYEIRCEGGKLSEVSECAANRGTEITVDNLFFNTPARAKFLKTPKSEESEITNIIARLILANPDISFKYTADGKTVYQSYGDGLEEAVIAVYGREAVANSFYIESEKHGVTVKGYVGKHDFTKPNRTYQTFILNGRYIINNTVSSAIANAYSAYLMKRNYPFYVLNVTVPAEFVDVNVHPNKTDVRFSNNQVIYGVLYSVISSVLDGSSKAIDIIKNPNADTVQVPAEDKKVNGGVESIPKHYSDTKFSFTNTAQNDKIVINDKARPGKDCMLKFSDYFTGYAEYKKRMQEAEKTEKTVSAKTGVAGCSEAAEEAAISDLSACGGKETSADSAEPRIRQAESAPAKQAEVFTSAAVQMDNRPEPDYKSVGQLFKTYALYEKGDEFVLIDQHAAHERLLYDELLEKLERHALVIQPMLIPFVLDVNPAEAQFLSDKTEDIRALGLDFNEFGKNKFTVSAVPAVLSEINLKEFFNYILSDLSSLKREKAGDVLKDKLMQTACKSAVKAGKELGDREKEILISKLKDNMGLKCPHGRPVAVKIGRQEIEKWFKRIV